MHWRISSFRMSSISSASNSISSSPSTGCGLGSNRLGSNGSVSRAVARYWANCQGSKIVLISATNAGISSRNLASVSAASRKFRNFFSDQVVEGLLGAELALDSLRRLALLDPNLVEIRVSPRSDIFVAF